MNELEGEESNGAALFSTKKRNAALSIRGLRRRSRPKPAPRRFPDTVRRGAWKSGFQVFDRRRNEEDGEKPEGPRPKQCGRKEEIPSN